MPQRAFDFCTNPPTLQYLIIRSLTNISDTLGFSICFSVSPFSWLLCTCVCFALMFTNVLKIGNSFLWYQCTQMHKDFQLCPCTGWKTEHLLNGLGLLTYNSNIGVLVLSYRCSLIKVCFLACIDICFILENPEFIFVFLCVLIKTNLFVGSLKDNPAV